MSGARVIVVGSVNVDLIMRVPDLPRPGETVVDGVLAEAFGGKGANQAAAAARLGARTWMVGAVGEDANGARATQDLADRGVDVTHVRRTDAATGLAFVVVDDAGENLIAVASGANHQLSAADVESALAAIGPASDAVLLANLEIPDAAVRAAALGAHARGARVVLNPAPAREVAADLLACTDVLVPNEHEVSALARSVEELLDLGVGAVVVTRGAAGVDVWTLGEPRAHQPACAVGAVDTTGAGDAFCGALAWALAEERSLEESVRLACAAGALATRAVGARASLADRAELEALVR